MKIRNGFVSNSSASSFILDKRTEGVVELLDLIKSREVQDYLIYGRSTAYGENEKIQEYIDYDEYGGAYSTFVMELLEVISQIGLENALVLRESDEQMGGLLFGDTWGMTDEKEKERIKSLYKKLETLALVESDTH